MRHGKRSAKLSMMTSHRKATVRNMVKSLLKHERIKTTLRRAKESRRLAEHLITIAKDSKSVHAQRRAFSYVTDRSLVARLFNEIAPLFKTRTSGFTRIIPLGVRRGDGAQMVILELTERKLVVKPKKERKAKKEKEKALPKEELKAHEAPKHEEEKHQKTKMKAALEEEKKIEKAKAEDKKIGDKKQFLKNLRGFFHRKTDM